MKTQYDDIPGLAGLPDDEKKRIVLAASGAVFKSPSFFVLLILQLAGFAGLAILLPRGPMHFVVVFAYILLTYLPLSRRWNRLVRQRIVESLAASD